jgi:hypothetical protein
LRSVISTWFFLSLGRLGTKDVFDPLCMVVIYTCCDGNPE